MAEVARTAAQRNAGVSLSAARVANQGASAAKYVSSGGSATPAAPSTGGIDTNYQKLPNESVSDYTARIAEYNTAKATEAGVAGPKQTGTMTADISLPVGSTKTVSAPAVVTSSAAEKDLAGKKMQADQLAADTAQHTAIVNQPQPAPATTPASSSTTTAAPSRESQSLDSQIDSIIGGLDADTAKIDADTAATNDPLAQQEADAQQQFNDASITALKKLNQIASGTYPLSATEKSLLASTTAGYQATISAQETANSAFTGQITEAMASLGINMSAPTQAIGLIHSAISSGEGKVADLNGKMAQSLATLTQGFQEQDYNMVSDAWEKTSTFLKDRRDTLMTMQKDVLAAAQIQKQDLKDRAEMVLKNVIDSAKFTYQQKQDAIQNAFSAAQIGETQRHNLATEALTRETNGAGGGTFSTTQINSGAAKAGVPVDVFRGWSADAKNVFINGDPEATKSTIDDALATGSVADVQAAIDEMQLPVEAKEYFKNYAAGNDNGESSLDKRTSAFADTFTDLMKQGYDRNEALDEVTNEWTDGGKDTLTKVDSRMIHDALTKTYGGVLLPNEMGDDGTIKTGVFNDGTGITRFGR